MFTTYILIFFFTISLGVVIAILTSSILKVKKDTVVNVDYDMYPIISLYAKIISKEIVEYSFKTLRFIFIFFNKEVKPILKKIKKIFLNYHHVFFDSVNGKNEMKKKGAASFFLKTVTQHKKDIKKLK